MDAATLVLKIRTDADLSLRQLAEAAGLATSTVHRIEQGRLDPTTDTLRQITEAAGVRIEFKPEVDHAVSVVGLARSIAPDLAAGDDTFPVRKAAELVHRFETADEATRKRMIRGEPPLVGDARWDAFLGALGEWLAVRHQMPSPPWALTSRRYLRQGWWVTPMTSMHAWEYAGSPASFQTHGVYLHRTSLTNV
jgi:transcriptional regulator with XRE-family HTH domain